MSRALLVQVLPRAPAIAHLCLVRRMSTRQMIIGSIIFLLTYGTPLALMTFTLHHLPKRWQARLDVSLAAISLLAACLLAASCPVPECDHRLTLFFSVVSVGSAIDAAHLDGRACDAGIFILVFATMILFSVTGDAYLETLRNYRY